MDKRSAVRNFHKAFEQTIRERADLPEISERSPRIKFLREEFQEYLDAEQHEDLVEIADALADMCYIIEGTALVYGIDLDAVFAEVHRSNMTKFEECCDDPDCLCGGSGLRVLKDKDGKVVKGSKYEKPDIASILARPNPSFEQRRENAIYQISELAIANDYFCTLVDTYQGNNMEQAKAVLNHVCEVISANPNNGYTVKGEFSFHPKRAS